MDDFEEILVSILAYLPLLQLIYGRGRLKSYSGKFNRLFLWQDFVKEIKREEGRKIKFGDTLFYKTENDDFFPSDDGQAPIDGSYEYIPRGIMRPLSFVLYRIIAKPIALLYTKLKFRERYIGREKLRPYRKCGYFMYMNHTQAIADAFTPNTVLYRKRVFVIVNKANLALPGIGRATVLLGALPLPDNLAAARNFNAAIEKRLGEGAAIAVYPEAHVWPYYTEIRDFPDTALEPAVKSGAPVFTATRVYKKRKRGNKPRCEIFIDGPFFRGGSLSRREARAKLWREVYSAMTERAAGSDIRYITYKKEE